MRDFTKYLIFLFICQLALFGCKKDEGKNNGRDPSQPVVISDFSPKAGAVRTRLYIYGTNLGDDISKIKVSIGDRELRIIGVSGDKIYCIVPKQTGSGEVKVVINGDDGAPVAEHIFSEGFTYVSKISVGTLVGKVDEYGNSAVINGTFEQAGFNDPTWMLFEPNTNSLFVVERDKLVRRVLINERQVSTLITNGQASFKALQTATMSFDNDTLFIVDDNGQNNKNFVAIAYTLRSENFRRVHPYLYDRTSYACAHHPVDHVMFFNTWWGGALMKAFYDPAIGGLNSRELFRVGGNNDFKTTIFFHPSGNYAYFLESGCVYKSNYNWAKKELSSPIVFAGQPGFTGDIDAIGTSARFSFLYQGVFVKNPAYAGKADEYDFYMCDVNNHSIRVLSPTGEVATYAGKGSPSSDGKKEGYIDGDLRKEARFNQPSGIAYDEERKILYISEKTNRRIRTISVE
ncbi:IPT/TIG domain-containing protein [Arcticibacter eurypsychrophilus]|uniref:IPT/TIG domain-containing protein n=1 Tax=Arcticibacter eurypsychrophilus TaxID=1434752 RepID=UPI00084D7CF7|nr:IPT/TIG domain-containing protein [Arcticibacter eurypsychrophilus]